MKSEEGLEEPTGSVRYMAQVKGEWAGMPNDGRWRPLCSGTLNQTGRSDEWASTFDTRWETEHFIQQALTAATESPIETRVIKVRCEGEE